MKNEEEIVIKILNNDVRLDETCWSCYGYEKEPAQRNEDGSCGICNGKRFIPTEAGQAILDLIQRHGKNDKK